MQRHSAAAMDPTLQAPVLRVLVVDDEKEIAELLAELLALDGHQVATASDGLAALDQLAREEYDLILSDLRMPALDGQGLYREIERRHPRLLSRLVFVTGNALSGESAEFFERTGARYLRKPFVMAEIRGVIQELLPPAA
ncbi:MAG: response regulator [Candidatus Rokubacteria bacterium]|nr:response regulator [Candidatus Rokubacteria bacterium]